ncbi:hypothetical protein PR003_g20183, partial [Phytophthora rubi]
AANDRIEITFDLSDDRSGEELMLKIGVTLTFNLVSR